jgi:ferric-dicitrate binding protein FerR (iron transport regulator)
MNSTQLIYRVLSGNASEEEKLRLEQWKALNDANRLEYEDIKMLWECSRGTGVVDFLEEGYREGWQQIKQRMLAIQQRSKRIRLMIVVVIFVFALCIMGWLAYYLGKQKIPSLHGHRVVDTSRVYR